MLQIPAVLQQRSFSKYRGKAGYSERVKKQTATKANKLKGFSVGKHLFSLNSEISNFCCRKFKSDFVRLLYATELCLQFLFFSSQFIISSLSSCHSLLPALHPVKIIIMRHAVVSADTHMHLHILAYIVCLLYATTDRQSD